MRSILFLSLALVALPACGGEAPAPSTPAAKATADAPAAPKGSASAVSLSEFHGLLSEELQVVDVRTPGEWAEGHVPHAKHLPLSDLSSANLDKIGIDASKPVYFVCASGNRSGRATQQMSGQGYQAVNVEGGTMGWIRAGHEVVVP